MTNTIILVLTMLIDTNQLGGLTPSQYGSNFNFVVQSSTNVAIPQNQWPLFTIIPTGPLIASQGPPGTAWTYPITTDLSTRFYVGQFTNYVNGGVGPFSQITPYFYRPPPGQVGARNSGF